MAEKVKVLTTCVVLVQTSAPNATLLWLYCSHPTYVPLLKDPTAKVERRVTEILKQLLKEKAIYETLFRTQTQFL